MRLIIGHRIILITPVNEHSESTLDSIRFILRVEQQLLHHYINDLDIDQKVQLVRASNELAENLIRQKYLAREEFVFFTIQQRNVLDPFRRILPAVMLDV